MALELRASCERCAAPLHECTFCASCSTELGAICPNCGGELVRRPRRPIP